MFLGTFGNLCLIIAMREEMEYSLRGKHGSLSNSKVPRILFMGKTIS
jgi:hypothetical protein